MGVEVWHGMTHLTTTGIPSETNLQGSLNFDLESSCQRHASHTWHQAVCMRPLSFNTCHDFSHRSFQIFPPSLGLRVSKLSVAMSIVELGIGYQAPTRSFDCMTWPPSCWYVAQASVPGQCPRVPYPPKSTYWTEPENGITNNMI